MKRKGTQFVAFLRCSMVLSRSFSDQAQSPVKAGIITVASRVHAHYGSFSSHDKIRASRASCDRLPEHSEHLEPLMTTVKQTAERMRKSVGLFHFTATGSTKRSTKQRADRGMSGWIRFVQQIWVITGRALVHATSAQIIPLLRISCSKSVPAYFR